MYRNKEAFVYCWTDHRTNKLYIGSHKGTTDDGYVCSSKLMLEEHKKRPEDFTRQIVAEGSFEDIRKLEEVLLNYFNVRENENFYNQHNGNGNFYALGPKTENHKKKLSESLKGRKRKDFTEETKQKMKKPKSEEHRKKFIGNSNAKGKKRSLESIEKNRLANIGKKRNDMSRKNIQIGQIKRYENLEQKEVQRIAAIKGWETRRKKDMNLV